MDSLKLFKGYGIPIELADDESFLQIKETLTRIGIASKKEKILWQSCNILHKRGFYHLMHFKELFLLDGRDSDISDIDIARRNTITLLLQDWGLLKIKNLDIIGNNVLDISQMKILSYKEKPEWQLCQKYAVGNKAKIMQY